MIALLGLLAGIGLGIWLEPSLPAALQPYLPIAIVAALDALFGAFRAYLEGNFTDKVFVVSFISNVLIAAMIVCRKYANPGKVLEQLLKDAQKRIK